MHRECQDHESKGFLKVFNNHIAYCSGGISSGFRHAKPEEFEPRLFEIRKTGKHTRSHQVPCKRSSLNHANAFVLDAGLTIYKFFGDDCSPFEKAKAAKIAFNMSQARGSKAHNEEIDDTFWELLGGPNEAVTLLEQTLTRVFKLTDEDSVVRTSEVAPSRDSLDDNDCFCIDIGHTIYVWVGSKSTKRESQQAMVYAHQLLTDFDKPKHTRITRVLAGQEEQTKFWENSGL